MNTCECARKVPVNSGNERQACSCGDPGAYTPNVPDRGQERGERAESISDCLSGNPLAGDPYGVYDSYEGVGFVLRNGDQQTECPCDVYKCNHHSGDDHRSWNVPSRIADLLAHHRCGLQAAEAERNVCQE